MRLNKESYKEYKTYPEKVLQFGEGNFLRAFVDWQIDKMNKKTGFNGSVVVVKPRENKAEETSLIDKLNEQDGLYTLYLQGMSEGNAIAEHSVINSISRGINPYTQHDEYLKIAENPELRFVFSNTTEAGIAYDKFDKLDDKPQKSFPGKFTALLYHRFITFSGQKDKGLIIIPCELIDRNGDKLKEIILKFAKLWDLEKEFVLWINESNTFCSTLVDRIVPGYPRDTIKEITQELGYEDSLVNVGEHFHLFIIEGPKWIENEFPATIAGLNVKFVDDMTPYRTRKVRILNGSHTSLVPVSYLYGLNTVAESVEHQVIGKFIKDTIYEEIIPTLDLPEEELAYYAKVVLERFMNPYVKHYLMSISLNSMSKYEARDLPSLLQFVKEKNKLPKRLVFSLAALMEFYKGKRGEEIIKVSDNADVLELYKTAWDKCDGTEVSLRELVTTILAYKKIWKMDLNEVNGLTELVFHYLFNIEKDGIGEAIKEVL